MKNQNFGIEIELTGITRRDAAKIMAEHFGIAEWNNVKQVDNILETFQ